MAEKKKKEKKRRRPRESEEGWGEPRPSGGFFKSYLKDKTPEGRDVKFYKPVAGKNILSILAWGDPDGPGEPLGILVPIHDNIGSENATYICLEKFEHKSEKYEGGKCPACEYTRSLIRKGVLDKKKRALLRTRDRWVIDVLARPKDEAVEVWGSPAPSIYDPLMEIRQDEVTGKLLPLSDEEEGYSLLFTYSAPVPNVKPGQFKAVALSRHPHPFDGSFYDEVYNLMDILHIPTYKEVYEDLYGIEFTGDGGVPEGVEAILSTPVWAREEEGKEVEPPEQVVKTPKTPKTEEVKEEEPAFDTGDCFGVEYDDYDECKGCPKNEACKEKQFPPEKERKKKEKSRRDREEAEPEQFEPLPGNEDCFGIKFDVYEVCDDCEQRDNCRTVMAREAAKK